MSDPQLYDWEMHNDNLTAWLVNEIMIVDRTTLIDSAYLPFTYHWIIIKYLYT